MAKRMKNSHKSLAQAAYALLDAFPVAAMLTRPDGELIYANRAFYEQYGPELRQDFLTLAENETERLKFFEAVDRQQDLNNYEVCIHTAAGKTYWELLSVRPFAVDDEPAFLVSMVNITARRRAEKAHFESEKRYRLLFENMTNGFALHEMIYDEQARPVDYRFLEVNPAFERITGISAQDICGKTLRELMPETEQYWIDTYNRVAQTGEPLAYQNFSKELQKYFDVWAFSPEKGKFATIFTDITERQQTEEKLSRQLARLHALYKIEQAVVSSVELNTILELLVQSLVEQLQVDAADVLLFNQRRNSLDFAVGQGFTTDALRFTRLPLGEGLAGQAALLRRVVHTPNLAEIPVLADAIADEKFVTYYGIPLVANDRLHGVIEIFHRSTLTPDPDWLLFLETIGDQAAIFIDNARLLESTRQTLKEANALYRINRELVATIDADVLMQTVADLLQDSFGYFYVQIFVAEPASGDFVVRAGSGALGRDIKSQGYRLSAGEGIVGFTAATGKPFFTNNVEEVLSFVRAPFLPEAQSELAVPIRVGNQFMGLIDVYQTAPAELSERDLQLVSAVADQLAIALQKAQMYDDLQSALQQEKTIRSQLIHSEKLTVAGRLLASVSHELNNPIQAIQNALFLLKEEKGLSEQGRQDLEIVLAETDRMASLLQRLRTTYQPFDFEHFEPIQVNALIEDVCALVSTHMRHRQIAFQFHADPELPILFGIADQLRQVMLNLFLNAVDAMPQGGNLTIATQFLPESNETLITISDTGPGIDAGIFPNMFDAFVTSKQNGTGLGLTISREIIHKHRGRIEARNNPDRGATFSIWLPNYSVEGR